MTTSLPSNQKVWRVIRSGNPTTALVLDTQVPVPTKIPTGEVLIKVQAAALNPVTYKLMRWFPNTIMKRVAEHDLAGEVVDPNGSDFKVGDNVFGFIHALHSLSTRQGTLAEYTYVPVTSVVHRPSNVSPVEASGITLTSLTAYQCLFDIAKLDEGQTVFINGGSTSVGIYAIQLAKAKGCKVVASASAKNEKFVKDIGADEFIDYTAAPLHEQLSSNPPNPKFHAIIDAYGLPDASLYTSSEAYLAPGGTFVSAGPQPGGFGSTLKLAWHFYLRPRWAGGTKRNFSIVSLKTNKTELEEIQKLVAEGKVKPVVDSVYEFEDVQKAFEKLMSSRAKGKIVVKVSL